MHLAVKPRPFELLGMAMIGDAVFHTLEGEAPEPAIRHHDGSGSLRERAIHYLSDHPVAMRLYIAAEFTVGLWLAKSARRNQPQAKTPAEEPVE